MSKKINIIFGLVAVAVAVFLCFIYCGRSNSAVFELQKGEAEELGVVFQEGEDLISKYDKYMEAKEYDKAIVVAKKAGEFSSDEGSGYFRLHDAYLEAEKYDEVLIVINKLIKITPEEIRYAIGYAEILEKMNKHDEAVKFIEKYKKSKACQNNSEFEDCPQLMDQLIQGNKF